MEAHHPRARLLGLVALAHVPRPDAAGGAQLRNLFEEVVVGIPEEREPSGKAVDVESAGDAALDVRKPVRQREGELLRRGGTGFANVIAGDRNRVPERRVLPAPLEHVDTYFKLGFDRIDPAMLSDVFLESLGLDRTAPVAD